MEELFDLYDDEGRPLGVTKERSLVHRDGDWHRSIHLWVIRADGRLLFQQRGAGKDTMPGLLTASVGGHYAAGEQLREVLREAREEIGWQANAEDLIALGLWRYEDTASDPGVIDRELQDVFFWPLEADLTEFRPAAAEVTALVEVAPRELLRLIEGRVRHIDVTRLRAGETRAERATVAIEDFVPSAEYHARVAGAALVYAGGGEPWLGVEPEE
ncbi:MAG TPA: NUDIX domain-containing protein [Chloroflexota bacterium]|nr:NUDIX domain-containing protein [Chloroflexota bacterium]